MSLDPSTFQFLQPTEDQKLQMDILRNAAAIYAAALDELPDGPDKERIIHDHRTNAMWANVCLTRHADGSPRTQ